MRRTFITLTVICSFLTTLAQNDEDQVLVYRNTGEVYLFYSTDLESISFSKKDADGIDHEEITSQIFLSKDTSLIVPISEIDSVAFGSRNAIEYKSDVRILTSEEDLPWIIRFDGNSVYYKLNTPESVLPAVGMKVFYGLESNVDETTKFPYGLSAKVNSVVRLSEEIRVDVDVVELSEIFSKFFYAGPIQLQNKAGSPKRASTLSGNIQLPVGEHGLFENSGTINVDGTAVINLLRNYYSANIDFDIIYGVNCSLQSDDSFEENVELLSNDITLATLYKILNINGAVGAFADIAATLDVKMELQRTYYRKIIWERKGNNNSFKLIDRTKGETYEDKALLDLTLDGKVYFGPLIRLDFTIIGDVAGARAKFKVGPEIESKLNIGMLTKMREYNPDFYGNGELSFCGKLSLEGYVTYRPYLIMGDVEERLICDLSLTFGEHKRYLFPQYVETKGAQLAKQDVTSISVSTKVEADVIHEIETGFEIVDSNDEIVDTKFVDTIKEENINQDLKGLSADFVIPRTDENVNSFRVRPIFKYAGQIISAKAEKVQRDMFMQLVVFTGSNRVISYLSGFPFTGSSKGNETLYTAGPYLPVIIADKVFYPNGWVIESSKVIEDENFLYGTWTGVENDSQVVYVFNDDGRTGLFNQQSFTFHVNYPTNGQIALYFPENETRILTITRVIDDAIEYRIGNSRISYKLVKSMY